MHLKPLLKRGALLTAANWPVIAIQYVAATTFQVLLAVPVIGAAILVAVLLGTDVAELLQGSLGDIFTAIVSTLMSEPVAIGAFITAFVLVLFGGSVLMFLVKGGTVDVIVAAHRAARAIESEPLTFNAMRAASQFTLQRFTAGCGRLFRPYLTVGLALMVVYAISAWAYLAFVIYGYRAATDRFLMLGVAIGAAVSAGLLVAWITIVNVLYLLTQIAIAVDGIGVSAALVVVAGFVRAEFRELAGIFCVVLALVVVATLASALAWSGVGLIAFVPLVGLAVVPLQLAALVVRGLVFQYLGLTALAAYVTLYVDYRDSRSHASERAEAAGRPRIELLPNAVLHDDQPQRP